MEIDEHLRGPWRGARIVFVTAPLGFGKTVLVRRMLAGQRFCELDALAEDLPSRLEPEELARYDAVVIDNLHAAQDQGRDISEVCRAAIVARPQTQFVLVSRAPMPGWLLRFFVGGEVLLVTRDDLWLSDADIASLLREAGVTPSPDTVEGLVRMARRYPFATVLAVRHLQGGMAWGPSLGDRVFEETMTYFEGEFERRFDTQTREAALALALFDEVDDDLLRAVLPEDGALRLREALLRETSFIEPGEHGWRVISGLREFCNWELQRRPRGRYVEQVVSLALRYYEARGDYASALELCGRGGYEERARDILLAHARSGRCDGSFYTLAERYRALPDESVASSPDLMRARSLADALCGDVPGSERWYGELCGLAKGADGGPRDHGRAEQSLAYLDLALPQRGTGNLPSALAALARANRGSDSPLMLSLTDGLPSVLDGAWDLSDWAERAGDAHDAVADMLPAVVGRDAVGALELLSCEGAFERGEDVSGRVLGITSLLSRIRREGTPAMELAAVGLLARIRLDGGRAEDALRLLDDLRRRLAQTDLEGPEASRLLRNLDALRCGVWLRQGRGEHVASWLEQNSPDPAQRILYPDRLVCQLTCLALVSRGELDDALALMAALGEQVEERDATLGRIDLALMRAIVAWRRGDESWRTQLGQALERSFGHGYVRPVTRYGAAVLPLLLEVQRAAGDVGEDEADWAAWLATLVRMARTQASFYPDFLVAAPGLAEPLTEAETQVLRLVCQNKSNAEIGRLLGIKLPTVKTHVSHILAKLGVSRRTQAADRARELHLV